VAVARAGALVPNAPVLLELIELAVQQEKRRLRTRLGA
jgi:hypothetical protein